MSIKNSSPLKKIIVAVLVTHVVAVLTLLISFREKVPTKKIVVYEKHLPKKTPLPVQKMPATKQISSTKKKPTGKPSIHKETNKTLASLEKSLEILSKQSTFSNPLFVPKMIRLSVEKNPSQKVTAAAYEKDLIEFLQTILEFKEPGEVKMEITIKENGQLLQCKTIHAKNIENENYLKNRLHKLNFPCFNAYDLSEKQLTFVVNFCSS